MNYEGREDLMMNDEVAYLILSNALSASKFNKLV